MTKKTRYKKLLASGLTTILIGCAATNNNQKNIVYSAQVDNNLEFLYSHITNSPPHHEFAYCGYGRNSGDTTYVERGEIPIIISATPISIHYQRCNPEELVIFIHSHINIPGIPCELSTIDVKTALTEDQDIWYGVMCGNTVNAWHKKTLEKLMTRDTLRVKDNERGVNQ